MRSGRPRRRSGRCTAASCSGSIVHDLAVVRAVAGDPVAIDRVDTWPDGTWPPSVGDRGPPRRWGAPVDRLAFPAGLPRLSRGRPLPLRARFHRADVPGAIPPVRTDVAGRVHRPGRDPPARGARLHRGGVRAPAPRVRARWSRTGRAPGPASPPGGRTSSPASAWSPASPPSGARDRRRGRRERERMTAETSADEPDHRPPGPAHPLGPGVVRAVPDVPAAPRRPRRRAPRADGGGQPDPLHPRRPVRDRRRLPRGPPGGRAAHPATRRRGSAGDRAVADPDGRVPGVGRDDGPQPGARLEPGDGARWRDAGRVPARHVRPHRADAADAASGRHRAGGRLARRPVRHRSQRLHVGVARRLGGRSRVPGRRLWQRRLPLRRPRSPEGQARRARGRERAVLRAAVDPGDVRHRPRRALPPPGGSRRGRERRPVEGARSGSRPSPNTPPEPTPEVRPTNSDRPGPASSVRARARTCS